MQRRMLISQPHSSAVLSRFGLSVLVEGLANHEGSTIASVSLTLEQGELALPAISTALRTGLLNPHLATQMTGRFADSVGRGFAISATFPHDPGLRDGLAAIRATVVWSDGVETASRLVSVDIELVAPHDFAAQVGPTTVGIALATYNPEPALFRRQIETIRRQAHSDWVCVVADDGSRPIFLDEIRAAISGDARFVLIEAARNGGFYRNFERALAALPPGCGYIAFADQDDEWEAEKLDVLVAALATSADELAFSDLAVYGPNATLLSETFWSHRRLEVESPIAIAIANTVTGMATLAKASMLDVAMPLPALPGQAYHDSWFALVALARGRLHYVPQPLARYVQHGGNHTGALKRPAAALALAADFARRCAKIALSAPRRSTRPHIGAELGALSRWSDTEAVRLSMQLEALRARVPLDDWRADSRTEFDELDRRPYAALFRIPARTWKDPYRRHVIVGLTLGRAFYAVMAGSSALTRRLRQLVAR